MDERGRSMRQLAGDDPVIVDVAKNHDATTAQVVLAWHLALGNIVIPKSVTPKRIEENFALFDFELTGSEMDTVGHIGTAQKVGPDPALFFDLS